MKKLHEQSNVPHPGYLELADHHQRALLEAIFEADPSAVAVLIGPELVYTFVNPVYRYLYYCCGGDIIGLSYESANQKAGYEGFLKKIQAVYRTGKPFVQNGVEYHFPDGTTRIFTLQARRFGWETEPAVLLILWDTTVTFQAQRIAEQARVKLESALESMTDAVFISDLEGNFIDFNEAFATFHRFKSKTECAKTLKEYPAFLDVYFPDGSLTPLEMWAVPRALRGEIATNAEYILHRKDTGDRWVGSYSFAPIRNPNGEIIGSVVVGRDITESKQAEEEIQRLLEEREQEKARLQSVINNIPDEVWFVDPSGQLVLVNDQVIKEFGPEILSEGAASQIAAKSEVYRPDGAVRLPEDAPPLRALRGEQVRDQEEIVRMPSSGELRYRQVSAVPMKDEQGKLLGSVSIVRDITERKQAEQALQESEANFRALANSIPQLAWMADGTGWIFWYNQRWFDYTGTTLDEMEGWGWQKVHHPEHVAQVTEKFRQHVEQGLAWEDTFPLRGADGQYRWFLSRAIPIHDEQGQVTRWFGTNTDITDRLKIEDELRASEATLEAFFAHSPGILNIEDDQFRYIKTDPLTPTYFGLDRQSIVGKAVGDLAPEFIEQFGQMMRRVIETGQPELNQEVFSPVPGRAGETAHWLANYFPVPLPGGKRGIGIMGVEITDLKKTEIALRESEQLYRAIGESIDYGVWVCAPDGRNLYASPSYLNLVGITQQQCSDFGWGDSLHPEDAERTIEAWKECVRSGGTWDIEHRFRGVDGQYHPILARGVPVRNEQGEIIYWAGINLDISRFKQTEEALRESETRLRAVFQSLTEGVVVLNPQGEVEEINAAIEQIYGHSLQELQDPALDLRFSIIRPDGTSYPVDEQPAILAMRTGQTVRDVELGVRLKNGQVSWRLVNAQPMYDNQGKLLGAVASLFDVTERKQAEQSLRYYATLLDQLGDAVIASDANYHITAWNAAARQMYGWSTEEVLGQVGLDVLQTEFPQADKARMLDSIAQTGSYWGEATQVRKDGTRFPVEVHSVVLRDAAGEITGYLSVNRDITERKQAEQVLRETQMELQMMVEAAGVGVWGFDLATMHISLDEQTRRMLDLPEDTPLGTAFFQNRVHPEDWPRVKKAFQQMIASRDRQEVEFRFHRPDGQECWLYLRGQNQSDPQGQPQQLMGVLMDVTERKCAQEEIQIKMDQIELQHRLLEQREQERLKIARDIHDGPVQELTGAHYALEGIQYTSEDEVLKQGLLAIRETIKNQVAELRAYAAELRPPALPKFGLGKAIRSHMETFQDKHPELMIQFEEQQVGDLLPEEVRLALFRIYQEALTNIAKHAHAKDVVIRLEKKKAEVRLEIQDDGSGFTISKDWLELARTGHLGLVGMRERAEAVEGTLEIVSQPGAGTTIRVEVPLG